MSNIAASKAKSRSNPKGKNINIPSKKSLINQLQWSFSVVLTQLLDLKSMYKKNGELSWIWTSFSFTYLKNIVLSKSHCKIELRNCKFFSFKSFSFGCFVSLVQVHHLQIYSQHLSLSKNLFKTPFFTFFFRTKCSLNMSRKTVITAGNTNFCLKTQTLHLIRFD